MENNIYDLTNIIRADALTKVFNRLVQKELRGTFYHFNEMIDNLNLNQYHFDEDEYDEVIEIITNSCAYNYVTLQNGKGYFVDANELVVKKFVDVVEPSERDDIWKQHFIINNKGDTEELRFIMGDD